MMSTTWGRSMRTHPAASTSTLYGDRSPCVFPSPASTSREDTRSSHRSENARGVAVERGQPWSCHAVVGADELHHQLRAEDLHRVRHPSAGGPQRAQRIELGGRPLAGHQLPPERGPLGHGPGLSGAADPATLGVAGVPVEHPVLGGAIGLDRQQTGLPAGNRTLQQSDVGLLAGLQPAERGVERGQRRDEPGRGRRRAHGWRRRSWSSSDRVVPARRRCGRRPRPPGRDRRRRCPGRRARNAPRRPDGGRATASGHGGAGFGRAGSSKSSTSPK